MAPSARSKKIVKEKGAQPDEFEESVAQALFDLEATNAELKTDLRDLFITSAKEIDVTGTSRFVGQVDPVALSKWLPWLIGAVPQCSVCEGGDGGGASHEENQCRIQGCPTSS